MKSIPEEVKAECVRLRTASRLSIGEISKSTGVSKGALSPILKNFPLTPDERKSRRSLPWNKGTRKFSAAESEVHKISQGFHLTGNQRGRVAEAAVLLRLCLRGFEIYQPQFEGEHTDLLVGLPKTRQVVRLQVKLAFRASRGMPVISLRRPGAKKYVAGDYDVLVGYDIYSDIAYVFSWDEVKDMTSGISVTEDSKEAWHKLNQGVAQTG